MNFFGKTPTVKEQQRANERQLRRVGREVERDRLQLEREEKKLELEIKKLAKDGNKEACAILAKQLIQIRKQKTRSIAANSKIQGITAQSKMMGANVALSSAMASTSRTMGNMNRIMQPQKLSADMKAFQQANMKMEMTEEIMNDTLDDVLEDSDDEEESADIINKVLDEIGIEISGDLAKAPAAARGKVGQKANVPTDDEIEAQLAKLQVPQ